MINLTLQHPKKNILKLVALSLLSSSLPSSAIDENPGSSEVRGVSRQAHVDELLSEMSSYRKMKIGRAIIRVGKGAGQVEEVLTKAAPVVSAIGSAFPGVAPIVIRSYAVTQKVLHGANEVLPRLGRIVEFENARNLSSRSYGERQTSRRNEIDSQIQKLTAQRAYLESLGSREKETYKVLIEMKKRYLEAYLDMQQKMQPN